MLKRNVVSIVVVTFAFVVVTMSAARAGDAAKPMVSVHPPVNLAKSVQPPADAEQGTSIGSGDVVVDTANGGDDTDAVWVQQLDLDGDGQLEEVTCLWDDEDKVLYLYDELDMDCALTDGEASSSLLVALYAEGNTPGSAVGSGWWAASLDETECTADDASVYGCRFDGAGNPTTCGEVDSIGDDTMSFED